MPTSSAASREGEEEEEEMQAEEPDEGDDEDDEGLLYDAYITQKVEGGVPHPTKIVETASLAATEPPVPNYDHQLKDIVDAGLISGPQLETVVYGNMRFSAPQDLWVQGENAGSFVRPGFFLADGAGVGKGRQIAALIAEHWRQGGRRVLWLSVSTDLKEDTIRDINALGLGGEIAVYPRDKSLPSAPKNLAANGVGAGVVFATYALLISGARSCKGRDSQSRDDFLGEDVSSRLKQLVEWLCGPGGQGDAAEPLIVLDECHKAKNLINKTGIPTQTGRAVLLLQELLPRAKVVYSSATGASEPSNLAYMARIGTWGHENMVKFTRSIERGGLAAMEMLAISFKAMGISVSRALSFEGATFELSEVPFNRRQAASYDRAAEFWQFLWKVFQACRSHARAHPEWRKAWMVANACFWGAHLRFFKTMLIASKVPELCKKVSAALRDGHCCVVGLQATGEAAAKHMGLEEGDEVDDLVSSPRVVLLNLVNVFFPTVAVWLPKEKVQDLFVKVKLQLDLWKDEWAQKDRDDARASRHIVLDMTAKLRPGQFEEAWAEVKRQEEAVKQEAEVQEAEAQEPTGDELRAVDALVKPLSLGRKRPPTSARTPLGVLKENTIGDSRAAAEPTTAKRQKIGSAVIDLTEDSDVEGPDLEAPRAANLLLPRSLVRQKAEALGGIINLIDDTDSDGGKDNGDEVQEVAPQEEKDVKEEEKELDWRALPLVLVPKVGNGTPSVSGSSAAAPHVAPWDLPELTDSDDDSLEPASNARRTQGSRRAAPLQDGWDEGIARPEVDAIVRLLHKGIEALELPANPLDEITAKCGGANNVAELTGRREQLLKDTEGGSCRMKRKAEHVSPDKVNLDEMAKFMEGKKLVAVISDAGSTGISLHADGGAMNQRRRVHFTLELPWSADKAIQQFGRSHRSNQASAPMYNILVSDCGGERRFASCAAKRLKSLGALTKGDRRAMGAGSDLKDFDILERYGKKAIKQIFKDINMVELGPRAGPRPGVKHPRLPKEIQEEFDSGQRQMCTSSASSDLIKNHPKTVAFYKHMQECLTAVGLMHARVEDRENSLAEPPDAEDVGEAEEAPAGPRDQESCRKKTKPQGCSVNRFLNRILGLRFAEQDCLFRYFEDNYNAELREARARGEWSTPTITLSSFTRLQRISRTILYTDKSTKAPVYVSHLRGHRRIQFDDAVKALRESQADCAEGGHIGGEAAGFYRYKDYQRPKNQNFTLFGARKKPHVVLATYNVPREQQDEHHETNDAERFKYKLVKPWGFSIRSVSLSDLQDQWVRCTEGEAKALWDTYYDLTETHCRHGPSCWRKKKGGDCHQGTWQDIYMVEGALLPIWGALTENQAKIINADSQLVHLFREASKKEISRASSEKERLIFPLVKAVLDSSQQQQRAGDGSGTSVLGLALTALQLRALKGILAQKLAAEAAKTANAETGELADPTATHKQQP